MCAVASLGFHADTEMSAILSWAFTLKHGGLGYEPQKLNRI
jgi:hypothetical protein